MIVFSLYNNKIYEENNYQEISCYTCTFWRTYNDHATLPSVNSLYTVGNENYANESTWQVGRFSRDDPLSRTCSELVPRSRDDACRGSCCSAPAAGRPEQPSGNASCLQTLD